MNPMCDSARNAQSRSLTATPRGTRKDVAVRSEKEIQEMVSVLERHNTSLGQTLFSMRSDGEAFDDVAAIFNDNGKLLCALKWVLGENTITIRSEGSEDELERGRR